MAANETMALASAASQVTAEYGFLNNTDSTKSLTLKKLGAVTNYGQDSSTSSAWAGSNTAMESADENELLIYKGFSKPNVDCKLTTNYPCPIKDGVLYGSRMDTMIRMVKDDGTVLFDTPITISITIQHQMVTGITPALVEQYLVRTLSSLYKDDGSSRIPELMRLSKTPTSN